MIWFSGWLKPRFEGLGLIKKSSSLIDKLNRFRSLYLFDDLVLSWNFIQLELSVQLLGRVGSGRNNPNHVRPYMGFLQNIPKKKKKTYSNVLERRTDSHSRARLSGKLTFQLLKLLRSQKWLSVNYYEINPTT